MDPITLGFLIAMLAAMAFVIVKIIRLTGSWLSTKLKQVVRSKGGVIAISGDKLQEILDDLAEQSVTISVEDADMLIVGVDQNGELGDIEFVEAEQGMDAAAAAFMNRNGDTIRISA